MVIEFVYLLWHVHEDKDLEHGQDIKLIGVYTSNEKAEKALFRAKRLDGFKDHQDGFEISEYKLDRDEWTSGFVTEK
ncbi:hypothetical protein [Pedobacter sp.]|uniref:DUF7336 domain-containing protein n=1 Tax=Pedobacter sp. TaxID=1411316 RepID=UPI0031E14D89